jgi:hypothetical protein
LEELGDLVLHEGDERGDDYGGAASSQDRRKLVAEGFAASSGHDDAGIAAGGEAADDGFLAGAEGFVAPVAMQGFVQEGTAVGVRSIGAVLS